MDLLLHAACAAWLLGGASPDEALTPGVAQPVPFAAGQVERTFTHRVTQDAHVHVAAWSDGRDPRLAITCADTHLEDDESGGGRAAYLELDAREGDVVSIVLLTEDAEEDATVVLALHEISRLTSAEEELLVETRSRLDEARNARTTEDRRRALHAVVRELRRLPDATLHEQPADLCRDAADLATQLGEHQLAGSLHGAALAFRQRHLPPYHADLQAARFDTALVLSRLGDLDGAAHLERLGRDAQTRIASLHDGQGRHADAAAARRVTYQHLRASRPPDDRELIVLSQQLAISLRRAGDFEGAYRLLRETHDDLATRRPETDAQALTVRTNLAVLERLLGRPDIARVHEERILELTLQKHPDDAIDVAFARRNLGQTLFELGRLEDALAQQRAVLDVLRARLDARDLSVLRARRNVAVTLQHLGRLREALDEQEAVLAIQREISEADDPALIATTISLAETRRKLGDLVGASSLLAALLDLGEGLAREDRVVVLANLAICRLGLGWNDEALASHREVLAITEDWLGSDHPDTLVARANLGATLGELHQLEEAERVLSATLALYEDGFPAEHPHLLACRASLAGVLARRGRTGDALALMERSHAALARTLPSGSSLRLDATFLLASLLIQHGDVGRARALLLEALPEVEALLASGVTLSQRAEREMATRAVRFIHALLSMPSADGYDAGDGTGDDTGNGTGDDLSAVLAFRGQADRRARFGARIREAAADDPDIVKALDAVRSSRQHFHQAYDAGRLDELDPLRVAMERNQEALNRGVSRLAGVPTTTSSLAALAGQLEDDEAAVTTITYARTTAGARLDEPGTPSVAAFVVDASATVRRVELGSAEDMRDLCGAFRSHLSQQVDDVRAPFDVRLPASTADDGTQLSRRLQPLFDALPPGTAALRVAPDDALASIPWEALPLGDESLLGDAFGVRYLESLTALAPRDLPATAPSLLVLGGIDYSGDRALDLSSPTGLSVPFLPLPATQQEAETIRELFASTHPGAPATTLCCAEATPGRFAREAAQARVVHIATHGFAREALPGPAGSRAADATAGVLSSLASGIALAGANTGTGVLTAFEISGLDLSGCELAVLSACDTNVGPRATGEALAGLNRALQIAGARNTITSLWKVSDRGAARFFATFYDHLWRRGLPLEDAFTSTRRSLRNEGLGPGVWAGFVLYTSGP